MGRLEQAAEEVAREIGGILKEKLRESDLKEFIEYGFYAGVGGTTYLTLGRLPKADNIDPFKKPHDWFFSVWRGMLVDLFEVGSILKDFDLTGGLLGSTQLKPFFFLGAPCDAIYQILKRSQIIDGIDTWLSVPPTVRLILTTMIPSMLFMLQKLIENTIEFG